MEIRYKLLEGGQKNLPVLEMAAGTRGPNKRITVSLLLVLFLGSSLLNPCVQGSSMKFSVVGFMVTISICATGIRPRSMAGDELL